MISPSGISRRVAEVPSWWSEKLSEEDLLRPSTFWSCCQLDGYPGGADDTEVGSSIESVG